MLPIIFWTLVFIAGAWALSTGLTSPQESRDDTVTPVTDSSDTDSTEARVGRAHRVT